MNDVRKMGSVTIPTDMDAVPETLDLLKRWGADAIRDCDGTEFPQELKDTGAKIYATYYTTRKDNAWSLTFISSRLMPVIRGMVSALSAAV